MATGPTRTKADQFIERIHKANLIAPRTIVFGKNKLDMLGELVFPLAWGQKAVLVTGFRSAEKSGLTDRLSALLSRYTIKVATIIKVHREPTVEMVTQAAEQVRQSHARLVISAGGGSVMDMGKALAALATNEGVIEDYIEGIGSRTLQKDALPHVAIPTVPGTGAEVTRNAVIHSPEKGYKKSLRSDKLLPAIALVDPSLMFGVPAHVIAAGGMDAITQLIESVLTINRRRETTELAKEALRMAREALALCYEDPNHYAAREIMALVSMLSGVCLTNAGLAMAHGIAAALGALFDVPHGLACGILLPHTLRYNRTACEPIMADVLAAFLNQPRPTPATIDEGIAAIESLQRWMQIPPDLKYLNLKPADLERLAHAAMGSSMSGNPIPMTPDKTLAFLETIA